MCASEERNRPLDCDIEDLRGALNTLYELLEAHAPMWYTEVHRAKAAAALQFVEE
jgi:hypothetical protein